MSLTEEQKDILLEMDEIVHMMEETIHPLKPEIRFLNVLWAQYLKLSRYVKELENMNFPEALNQ